MSHYFYNNAFDFVSSDGDFGYSIDRDKSNNTTESFGVPEEYVVEVHYLGSAVTTLSLDVTNITHTGTLDDLYYVEKGFHDDLRSNPDGELIYDYNTTYATYDTADIISGGGTSWGLEMSGPNPTMGLIEIHIPATLTHQQQLDAGNSHARDHDYLQMEAGLYFDIIQPSSTLVQELQDVVDGNATLTQFATALDTAIGSVDSSMDTALTQANIDGGSTITDASNDITTKYVTFGTQTFEDGYQLNEMPHMIHFDHVNYNAYDDFSVAPTQLNAGQQMNSYSETTLIGEFRIDENAEGAWSFDTDMTVYLNNNTRTYNNPLMVDMGQTQSITEEIFKGHKITDSGATNTLQADSYYVAFKQYNNNQDIIGYELQEVVYDNASGAYQLVHGSTPQALTSDKAIDSSFFTVGSDYSFMHHVSVPSDLNQSFMNDTSGNINTSNVKTTISRDANGDLSFTEVVPLINTLTNNSTVTLTENKTYDNISLSTGTYTINAYNNQYGGKDLYLEQIIDSGNGYYKTTTTHIPTATGTAADLLISDINDGSLQIGTAPPMVFDGLGVNWNVATINNPYLSYDDNGSKSSDLIPNGDYIVNKIAPDNVTLTKIGPDTDHDSIRELDSSSYKLYVGGQYNEVASLEDAINTEGNSSTNINNYILNTDYETAESIIYKIDELGQTWNSVQLTNSYYTEDGTNVPHAHYKVIYDANTSTVTLQETTFLDPDYDVTNNIYVLRADSSSQFVQNVNNNSQTVTQAEYKQYFYDLINSETVDPNETITYATEYVTLNGGTEWASGTFDNAGINFINTDVVATSNQTNTVVTNLEAGDSEDFVAGGVGGFTIDGGSGLDMYLATPTTLKIVKDQNQNIIEEGGVKIDLSADRVIYLDSGEEDIVSNIEAFMGTLGDDQFIGSALHSTNINSNYTYDIQAFNPTAGKDEIFGAETVDDINNPGQVIDVQTVVTYDGMSGGQGVIFIMDGSAAATHAAEGAGEISLAKINEFAGDYWNDTSWAGDGWLPSNEDILNDNGHLSTVSKYEVDKQGGTLILDSFGDTDLAFNVDHYIGSGDADIFFGSAGDDSFDAATGTGNYMSGGAGIEDQLVVSDQNELEAVDGGGSKDAGEDIDLDSIEINKIIDYTFSDQREVNIDTSAGNPTSGQLILDTGGAHTTGTSYRIDFADVANLSDFYESNLATAVSDLYSVSTEYQLFIKSSMDYSNNGSLPGGSTFTFDSTNNKIDVSGTDISVLNSLSGQLVLAQQNAVIEGYIVEGVDNDGAAYNTVIKDVEQVSLLSDDVAYFGTGGISGAQEDIYKLIVGGQGDLGEMLYVETGETLDSTTGVGSYTAGDNFNFINGEIFYSGHHTDFDRNTTNPSTWANSVASAFVVSGQDTAKIWNNEVAQFFVWYDADKTDNIDGYEIAVKFQNGNINAWGIDNRQFDTFQNVNVDQNLADAINTEFGDSVSVELGEYRILYEAAYTDIETLISSDADVTKWNFDFQPTSSRSTFYIQVGGDATGENGSAGIVDNLVTNVKVERVEVNGQYEWLVNPQAEILVNLPNLAGATAEDNLMISGNSAETIEGGRGSDVMMGRGGSDNYKINAGDTLDANGNEVVGSYGVAGDVINEIGGSSEDKSDAITLSSAKTIDELTFSRTEIASEYWGNTLKIDVEYTGGGTDILYVFDHYNQNLESRAVEQLFLDDGWDSNEIWNLIVGDVNGTTRVDEYIGTAGQDVLIAGTEKSTLYGGTGQDIMIGDKYSKETTFELGNRDGAWDQVADIIQGFGTGDKLDLSALGISAVEDIQVSGNELQVAADNTVIAEFSNFNDSLTLDQLLTEEGAIIYASAS